MKRGGSARPLIKDENKDKLKLNLKENYKDQAKLLKGVKGESPIIKTSGSTQNKSSSQADVISTSFSKDVSSLSNALTGLSRGAI